ncbi:hypothetical protein QQS21_007846 [Conoideocrella luteorostrata]|uniref:Amino acid transporter transmembrane domain-containing protein n=1 Tax=Conoideocrella luteorostrata TaxID=1105319 RepID=A0AAJ0CMR8_9HYPO|nr:hypothetical protein QQS21_007846 [Conoideocrella luteorostrata]
MSHVPGNPTSWDEYQGRLSLSESIGSNIIDEENALLDSDGDCRHSGIIVRERRRSSVTNRIAAIADIGGVNSFRSFARSWQRAASFAEVIPRRPSFVFAAEPEFFAGSSSDGIQYNRSHIDGIPPPHMGLLRQHLEASPPKDPVAVPLRQDAGAGSAAAEGSLRIDFRERERKALDAELASSTVLVGSPSTRSSIFAVPPHLAVPDVVGSYESPYGTLNASRYRSRSSAGYDSIWAAHDETREADETDTSLGEERPILVKEVKQGDRLILAVEGQSTLPQSTFNSINAIIGVGLLSLPLAFKMSGWIIGLTLLTLTATVTSHTGKLLGKCMEYDPSIITYSDLAYVAFGTRARIIVSALFTLELVAACVALLILFSDSLDLLLPHFANGTIWKCYVLDTCLAVVGVIMFGDGIKEAITSNVLRTSGYPESLTVIMCCFISVIPLTKIPLNARPLITTVDVMCGIHQERNHHSTGPNAQHWVLGNISKAVTRVVVVLVLLGISILFPAFDSVCAFLGAALCSLISVILPICFYLKLYSKDITKRERSISWILLIMFSIFGIVGTIWTLLPRHLVGAD